MMLLVLDLEGLGNPSPVPASKEGIRVGLGDTAKGGATITDALWITGALEAERLPIMPGKLAEALLLTVFDADAG